MSEIIEDGTGNGYKAKINASNRLVVQAVAEDKLTQLTGEGGAWSISTGVINLTSANVSSLAWLKNTGTVPLLLRDLWITSSKSNESTGTVNPKQTLKLEVCAVVVSEDLPTAITPISNRSSKEKNLSLTVEKGVEGSLATTGATVTTYLLPCGEPHVIANSNNYFYLEAGSSIAIKITPPSGNTSLDVALASTIYSVEKEDDT